MLLQCCPIDFTQNFTAFGVAEILTEDRELSVRVPLACQERHQLLAFLQSSINGCAHEGDLSDHA